ncbi:RNA 2',3'-cyclic phosphodiesterase [Stutzerimonas tarimensis]|uniref:RNA 2',3'-cyclic phosphodiesterase n=1 Tax=Stutzerimonas tarimensis TaxID=1507735 RepID=A0ABV7T267_9GAMM
MTDGLRLFFALPCPPAEAERITAWRNSLARQPGRSVAQDNLHVTLAFLGRQPAARLASLRTLAGALRTEPFELRLERLGLTAGGVLWLEPSDAPAALLQLATGLREALAEAGVDYDRQEFRPHLTLYRQADARPEGASPVLAWQVDRFALYHSQDTAAGVRYRSLADWPI